MTEGNVDFNIALPFRSVGIYAVQSILGEKTYCTLNV